MPAQIPFLSPLQLIETPAAAMVPRAIWPGKPVMVTGLTFSREFYELPPTTASADTLLGGLYWYGGWIPLLTDMFLAGCGVRLLARRRAGRAGEPARDLPGTAAVPCTDRGRG